MFSKMGSTVGLGKADPKNETGSRVHGNVKRLQFVRCPVITGFCIITCRFAFPKTLYARIYMWLNVTELSLAP